MRQRLFDSLFARLLLMQTVLFLVLGLVFVLYFYIERNTTIAALYADRWAPQLAAAAGLPGPPRPADAAVLQRESVPAKATRPAPNTPRYVVLRRALHERGVDIDDVRVSLDEAEPRFWLHVVPPGRPPLWLGVTGRFIAADWSEKAALGLLFVMAVLVLVSWGFTRRFTRPLEHLRERIAAHTPGGDAPGSVEPERGASAEIGAISAAYDALLARLRRHERERAVLLAGVSHDLRSPLARIRMAAELLPDADEAAARKAAIVRNVVATDRLIESFMDLARSSELAFDETVDLAAAARAAVAGFERPAVELAVDAPEALPWPHANRLLVERLIANLVDNALKHGAAPVRVRVHGDADTARVEVDDAGPGIAPSLVEHLQEAFTRGDDSRSRAGTGLGLAIVRQVAARLGGSVSFERRDHGQRVSVQLRARSAPHRE